MPSSLKTMKILISKIIRHGLPLTKLAMQVNPLFGNATRQTDLSNEVKFFFAAV